MEIIKFKKIDQKFVKGIFILQIPEDGVWISDFKLLKGKFGYYVASPRVDTIDGKKKDIVALTKATNEKITKDALVIFNRK